MLGDEPEGKLAGGVLEEHGDEAFHRTEGGAVDHHRTVLLVVSAGIFQAEALGEVIVHLDSTELPTAADGILNHEVKFRAIEGSFALYLASPETLLGASLDDGILSEMPVLVRADIFLLVLRVAQRYLYFEVLEIESLKDIEDDIHHLEELTLDLLGGAEEVGIILRKSAHASQAMELTALFVAIDGAELGKAEGQLTVAARISLEDLTVVGAVHRLEHILLSLLRGLDRLE